MAALYYCDLAQFFFAPAARLSYLGNFGFIFICPFLVLYYSVSGLKFFRACGEAIFF